MMKEAEASRYKPEPRRIGMDSEYPILDANDVWFYQNEIERTLRIGCMPETAQRLTAMLWHLGAQARRAIPKENG
jgi:hypothetical protein